MNAFFAAALIAAIPAITTAQSISTLAPNNGSGGVFLELTPAIAPLTVSSFQTYFSGTVGNPVNVEVWTRPGTFAGFTASNVGWTLSETVVGIAAGTTTLSGPVVLVTPIAIPLGGPTAIYLHATTAAGGIRYQGTGTTSTQTFSNADVTLFSNVSRTGAVAFAGTQFTPRAFSGAINYAPGSFTHLAGGCPNSAASVATLSLQGVPRPTIGTTMTLAVTGAPASTPIAGIALGFATLAPANGGIDLGLIGAPFGCVLYPNPVATLPLTIDGLGAGTSSVPIGPGAGSLGLTFFVQGVFADLALPNAIPVVTGDAKIGVIGN